MYTQGVLNSMMRCSFWSSVSSLASRRARLTFSDLFQIVLIVTYIHIEYSYYIVKTIH